MAIDDIKNIWSKCSVFGAVLLTFVVLIQELVSLLAGPIAMIADALSIGADIAGVIPEPTDDPICEL